MLTVKVNDTPEDMKDGWMVAQRDQYTAELWFYEMCDTEERAYDLAQELDDGIVVEVCV